MSGQSVEDVLTRLLRRGQLRPATAIDRIQRAGAGLTRIGIQDGLAALARDNRITGVTINGQVVGMVGWREAPIELPDPLLIDWQNAVSGIEQLDPERRAVLMTPPGAALALDEEDRQALIDCLSKLSTQANRGGEPIRLFRHRNYGLVESTRWFSVTCGTLAREGRWREAAPSAVRHNCRTGHADFRIIHRKS
jgi:hypothetical protein